MDSQNCPLRYQPTDVGCSHYLFPMDMWTIVGTLVLCFTNGLSTLAGIGGGAISLVVLLMFFSYLPKDATMVVFCAILGASSGNISNLVQKAHNGKPLVQYQYVFISIPLMFTGSLIGILLNKLLPSIVVCSIIVGVFGSTIAKTYRRFLTEH